VTVVEALPSDPDHLQVVEGDHGRRIAGYVEPLGGLNEFLAKEPLFPFGECLKGVAHRSEVLVEEVDEVAGRAKARHYAAVRRRQVVDSVAEQSPNVLLNTPEPWWPLYPRWLNVVGRDYRELRGQAVGRETRHPDLPARLANAKELGGRSLLVRDEHHSERREDGIERAIGVGDSFGVPHAELDSQPLDGSPVAGLLQQGGDVVDTHHIAVAASGCQCAVPRSGRNVQYALPGPEVDSLAEQFADEHDRRGEPDRIPAAPDSLLGLIETVQIDHASMVAALADLPPIFGVRGPQPLG